METEIGARAVGLLKDLRLVRVATISSKGDPFVVPVQFHFDGSALYFVSAEGFPLITNVRANRRVALVGDIGQGDSLEGVIIQGLATIVRGRGEEQRVLKALSEKYPGHSAGEGKDSLVKVVPTRVLDLLGREG